MKIIDFNELFEFLEDCHAVAVDGDVLVYPSLSDDDELFLWLSWENDKGLIFELSFRKEDNRTAVIKNWTLELTDSEGDVVDITLLKKWDAENS